MRFRLKLLFLLLVPVGFLQAADTSVSHLELTDNGRLEVAFSEVEATLSKSEVIETESRDPDDPPLKTPGRLLLTSLTLTRPYTADETFAQWREQIKEGSMDSVATRDLTLIAFDERGEELSSWDLPSAWPSQRTVSVNEEGSWEEVTIVFDELPLEEGQPALPVVSIQLPAQEQTIEEPPVRVMAEVKSPDSEVEILRIYGEDELLGEVSYPGTRSEVEWNVDGDGEKNLSAMVIDDHDRTVTVTRNFTYFPSPGIRYSTWRQAWFLPEEDGTPAGGEDLGGSANLVEFAFRGHPHSGSISERPRLKTSTAEDAWAEFSYVRRKGGTGSAVDYVRSEIRYIVEETTDLGNDEWTASPVPDGVTRSATVVPNEDGFTETVTISLLGDPPTDTLFKRLRINFD
ncbi:MAG: phage tail protein [Opitutales bacterium]|nr:phage tail protein [Opitutales bacterium]MCH8541834.1 phage tail protein [Opitutales bacterium]